LSGSERQRPGWFLDMKYQTCYSSQSLHEATTDGSVFLDKHSK